MTVRDMEYYPTIEPVNDKVRVLHEVFNDDGSTTRYVDVWDESATSETLLRTQAAIALADGELADHPDWQPPVVSADKVLTSLNPVSEMIYQYPTMRAWRAQLVPTALALYPIQFPFSTHLPDKDKTPIDADTARLFLDAKDSVGIRTRAQIMRSIAQNNIQGGSSVSWISVACGAAVPVFDAQQELKRHDIQVHLKLIDFDPAALEFATQLAGDYDLQEGRDFAVMRRNIYKTLVFGNGIIEELGEESAQMVDALGITEYISNQHVPTFLRQIHRLVNPGGTMVFGNMLSSRSELDFNQRGVGWPQIIPRSLEQIKSLVQQAGIPLSAVTITIPEDGIYAVVEVRKNNE